MKYFLCFTLLFYTYTTVAHDLSTTYIDANLQNDGRLSGEFKIKVIELKDIIAIDANQDGKVTWGELTQSKGKIGSVIVDGFSLSRANTTCPIIVSEEMSLQDLGNHTYVIIPFIAQCNLAGALTIKYDLFFNTLSTHKSIVNLRSGDNKHLLVLTSATKNITLNVEEGSKIQTFYSFVYQGIYHIGIGLDHILFLLTLLLTVCLHRNNNRWEAIHSKGVIVKRTVWIVTSFTLAHSITLTGTALGLIPTMGSWIEVVIAASILFNVVNNIFPFLSKLSLITFVFGLIHGMGFAGALAELGLPSDQNYLAVAAFNIGVELGQLGLLILFLPPLIACRYSNKYRKWYMNSLSILIGALSIYWIVERLFM